MLENKGQTELDDLRKKKKNFAITSEAYFSKEPASVKYQVDEVGSLPK